MEAAEPILTDGESQSSGGSDEAVEVAQEHPPRGESHPAVATRSVDASIYTTTIDLNDENDSHTLVVRMVGADKRVLELGCATGSASKIFKERGCTVTAIEIDAEAAQMAKEWADEVIVGDLDSMDLRAVLGDRTFDTIVAADVLEHLKDQRGVSRPASSTSSPLAKS